jgi:hypothetical protein
MAATPSLGKTALKIVWRLSTILRRSQDVVLAFHHDGG